MRWGGSLLPYDRSLDTHISNLRRKFDALCAMMASQYASVPFAARAIRLLQ